MPADIALFFATRFIAIAALAYRYECDIAIIISAREEQVVIILDSFTPPRAFHASRHFQPPQQLAGRLAAFTALERVDYYMLHILSRHDDEEKSGNFKYHASLFLAQPPDYFALMPLLIIRRAAYSHAIKPHKPQPRAL